mmetsp:Transcript_24627/g.24861  ORF Transcript_24627/g.24861 Transcript_24627/m.24861 type:complete len:538 (+) Transcript_24627:111-1724(+)
MDKSLHTISEMCDRSVHNIKEAIVKGTGGHLEMTGIPTDEEQCDDDQIDLLQPQSNNGKILKLFLSWVYPENVPIEVQLWRLDNIAIPFSYLMVGTFQGLSSGVMTVFLLRLGASEQEQNTIGSLRALPASLKIIFGFISDTTPVFGYRRKFYMIFGWILSSFSMAFISSIKTPSIPVLSLAYFSFGLGFWFSDVIADSLMAEKARFELEETRGTLQSVCYSCRFFALMVSSIAATYAMEKSDPTDIFRSMAILPWMIMMPSIWFLKEINDGVVTSVSSQCKEIWSTICSRAVWQPMAFVYIFNILQVGNAAWLQYLYTTLKFTTVEINSFFIASTILIYIGIILYKTFLLKWSWRNIYIIAGFLNLLLSGLQILLLYGINRKIGISDYVFAFGDDAMADLLAGMTFLPDTIMMAHLCPVGSEGASFAMFTTINNSAGLVASAISTQLLNIWDVSKTALERNDMTGMVNLTVLTTAIQTTGLLFVGMLPHRVNDLKALNLSNSSLIGGGLFLFVITVSIIYAIVSSILYILVPTWAG